MKTVKRRMGKNTRSARDPDKDRVRVCETNKKKRSVVKGCVRKETEEIYICPLMGVC